MRRRQWHPLQYSCLENPMDGGAWWAAVHGVAKSRTRLSHLPFTFHFPFSVSCIGDGNGNPLQCSCLENPRYGRVWWAPVYGVAQSWTQLKRLSSSSSSRLFYLWDFSGKNTGAGCHFLLQGIFPTQGLNPYLLNWQADSLPLVPPGKPT